MKHFICLAMNVARVLWYMNHETCIYVNTYTIFGIILYGRRCSKVSNVRAFPSLSNRSRSRGSVCKSNMTITNNHFFIKDSN